MHASEESNTGIVPPKSPNQAGGDARGERARKNKQERFTALLQHVTPDLLRQSFYALKRKAAPGADGVNWNEYATGLEDRLNDLHSRVHRGAYRARPSQRRWTRKAMASNGHGAWRPWRIRLSNRPL